MKILLLAFLTSFFTIDQGEKQQIDINRLIDEDMTELVDFYKNCHQHPEVSLEEKETSKRLAVEMRNLGFDVTENFGGYGIVAMMKNGEGPQILYRTDMDALPVPEKTNLPYASKATADVNGQAVPTMHACGHDIHMTTWLGTAKAMVKMKDQWSGTLMMIGQPAEEIGAGARLMLKAGLYDKFGVPDMGVGLHSSPSIKAGKVGMGKGYTMANTESIDIKVFGIGAHGASPHMSIDPVVIASMIVMDLQTIVSRSVKPTEAAVVTVGAIKGGTKHNIIPDEVVLQLTVRTYTSEVRTLVHRRIREISRGIAIAAGLSEDKMPEVIIPEDYTMANYNNPELVDRLTASSTTAIGAKNVVEAEPQMVGEDFALYGHTKDKVPTVLFWLGTISQEKLDRGNLPGLHSPFYYPEPMESIKTGIQVMAQSLLDLMSK